MAGDKLVIDRRHPVAPVTYAGLSLMDPDYLQALATIVFRSRRHIAGREGPALTVTPSIIGAQRTIEHLHAELRGWETSAKRRAEELREIRRAVRAALATPAETAPPERHASGLLGTEGFHRLAESLGKLRNRVDLEHSRRRKS